MDVEERVAHILSVTKDKERINKWLDDKIGKKVHHVLNPNNLNQTQIDFYWIEVKKEINNKLF